MFWHNWCLAVLTYSHKVIKLIMNPPVVPCVATLRLVEIAFADIEERFGEGWEDWEEGALVARYGLVHDCILTVYIDRQLNGGMGGEALRIQLEGFRKTFSFASDLCYKFHTNEIFIPLTTTPDDFSCSVWAHVCSIFHSSIPFCSLRAS